MGLTIHHEAITSRVAQALRAVCPFDALDWENDMLRVNARCRACKLCVRNGPVGAVTWVEEAAPAVDKAAWRGVAVYAETRGAELHPVTLELLGKAGELAAVTGHPVYAVLVGHGVEAPARELLHYGADRVYVYDHPAFAHWNVALYANAFGDFVELVRPSSVLVGATNFGRSLAPVVAARCGAGLTADCTVLRMKENSDLVQIRPAFGGNIMAQIVTPSARPQFCTVRYKIFSAPRRMEESGGEVRPMAVAGELLRSRTRVLRVEPKPAELDLSEAEVIVACGRGVRSEADLEMAEELAGLLGAQLACTRPLIEAGWMGPKRQIGLSGRTVKPGLIITLGVSGSVQFAAGMGGSDRIVAVNSDPRAAIFAIAHVGLVGDLYQIVPRLISHIRGGGAHD